jgi:hypothetical protein
VRVITLYGVDRTVGRTVMVGGVGEGEGSRSAEDPSGMIKLHVGLTDFDQRGRHVRKRNVKFKESTGQ